MYCFTTILVMLLIATKIHVTNKDVKQRTHLRVQVTMEELRCGHADPEKLTSSAPESSSGVAGDSAAKRKPLTDTNPVSAVNRVWGGDKRLSLYGYTLETINLLLLPMMQSKYVHSYLSSILCCFFVLSFRYRINFVRIRTTACLVCRADQPPPMIYQ